MKKSMNERTTAMGLSVVGGLILIVIIPKLINGLLQLTSARTSSDAGYATGQMFVHALILALGIFCFVKARKYWQAAREQDIANQGEEEEMDDTEYSDDPEERR
jgi:hypothetical protein